MVILLLRAALMGKQRIKPGKSQDYTFYRLSNNINFIVADTVKKQNVPS